MSFIFKIILVLVWGGATEAFSSSYLPVVKDYCRKKFAEASKDNMSSDLINLIQTKEWPTEDFPDDETLKSLENEDPEKFYYGFDGEPDYKKARYAAFAYLKKMASEKTTEDSNIIGPASVLMMIYANGLGVKRDIDLAMFFAVIVSWAPAELEGRINHLIKLKGQTKPEAGFSLCDDITSGFMAGYCASLGKQSQDVKDKKQVSALIEKWTLEERKAFEPLTVAKEKYYQEKSRNEIDQSGTMRTALVLAEEEKRQQNFLSLLQKFEKKDYLKYSQDDFDKADQQLNKIYQKLMKKIPEGGSISHTTIEKQGIKETQRAWILYRDAWTSFAKIKYPEMTEYALKTLLTNERIKDLEELEAFN